MLARSSLAAGVTLLGLAGLCFGQYPNAVPGWGYPASSVPAWGYPVSYASYPVPGGYYPAGGFSVGQPNMPIQLMQYAVPQPTLPAQVVQAAPPPAAVPAPAPAAAEPTVAPPVGSSVGVNPVSNAGWQVGAGFYYLAPHWNDAIAFTTITTTVINGANTSIANGSERLGDDPGFAPKVWIGYTGDSGLGLRVSWWQLETTTSVATAVAPSTANSKTRLIIPTISAASDDVLTGGFGVPRQGDIVVDSAPRGSHLVSNAAMTGRVDLGVVDLDITQQIQAGAWSLLIGGGGRYARLHQTFAALALTPLANSTTLVQTLDLGNKFEGAGLDVLAEAHRPLGGLGLEIYGSARSGLLFGGTQLDQTQLAQVMTAPGAFSFNSPVDRVTSASTSMPFIEFEVGVQWSGTWGTVSPFVRAGIASQQWFGAGSPTSTANNKNGDLGLFGLQLVAGSAF